MSSNYNKRMIRGLIFLIFSFILTTTVNAQVGIGTTTPNTSSILDLTSTNKAFILPRMTTVQRNQIANPVAGMIIFNTDSACSEIYRGSGWFDMCKATSSVSFPSVTICNQTWMLNNLSIAKYRNGDSIPQVTDPTQWSNLTTGAWCWYNNDSATYGVYGELYNWYAVNDPRGLAPDGWHIPGDAEWNILATCLDPAADTSCISCNQSNIAGAAMKDTGNVYWVSPNTGATNSCGLTCLPAGFRNLGGLFQAVGSSCYLWSSSEISGYIYYRVLLYDYSGLNREGQSSVVITKQGFPVRCVKD
jgi:uncharacterized protein (TIGR02145 family)